MPPEHSHHTFVLWILAKNWLIARSLLSRHSSTQCEEREAKSASPDEVDSKTKLRRLQSGILKATEKGLYNMQQAEMARLLRCKLAKKYQTHQDIREKGQPRHQ
jgi:hypothetical protein